jgi:hypothetical protein
MKRVITGLGLITGLALMLGLGLLYSNQPALAGPGLPSRDTPTPKPHRDHEDDESSSLPAGAYIELHMSGAPAGSWAVVQWQDSTGNWHDVEGWQGVIANSSRWWVHPKDFSTGPFRWVVKSGPAGALVSQSPLFDLASGAGEKLAVSIP